MIEITIAKSFEEIDKEKFAQLVQSGFNKFLIPGYFSETNPEYICLAMTNGHYIGAIVVESIPGLEGVSYLDKIVVAHEHKGNGLGKMLWEHLNGTSQKVIWRAKKENPIIDFYRKKSSGTLSFPDITDFMFFYYGLTSKELEKALTYVIGKKPNLVEVKPS